MYYIILFINLYLCLLCDSSIIPSGPKEELIVKGKDASEGQFPYAVALYYNRQFTCTGSIITEKSVLTAAHCVLNNGRLLKARDFYAIANYDRTAKQYRMNFTKIDAHPKYNDDNITNDIALMTTTEAIPFRNNVNRICLADENFSAPEGTRTLVVGWGYTSNSNRKIPSILQFAEHEIVSNGNCSEKHRLPWINDDKMCATDSTAGTCSGDSGGPLVSADNKVQMGITSYGPRPCAAAPGVFTRVSKQHNFIKSKVVGGPICYKSSS